MRSARRSTLVVTVSTIDHHQIYRVDKIYLGARARAGGPASRGCPGRAAGRDAPARPVARWPLVLSVSVPDGECIVVVGIVWSACAALRDSLLATHGTAWNETCRGEPRRRRRACWHAGCARAHGRSGSSAPWPSGWLAAVQRSRDGDSRARQPRPSANGSRQLRWGGSHTFSF